MKIQLDIRKVQIVRSPASDSIHMQTSSHPSTMPLVSKSPLTIEFRTERGTGVDYVFKNFPGIERIEVIESGASPPTHTALRKDWLDKG